MDLRNWEFFSTGSAVSGANVYVYEADLAHPNPNAAITSTTTSAAGMWSFVGLSDTPKDVKVEYGGRAKWYKGLTLHSVYAVRENAEDAHLESNWTENGGFEVNTGASSFTPGTSNGAIVDKWESRRGSGDALTIDRVTTPVPTTSQYALRCVYTKSSGNAYVEYNLPTALVYALRGRAVSGSAQVQQGAASALRFYITDGVATTNASNSATTGSYITTSVQNFTVAATATSLKWGVELQVSGTHYLDNVMLNVGTTVETFVPQFDDRELSYTIVEAAPTQDTSSLATLLNNLAERVRGVIGAAGNDWKDAIPRTLTQLVADVAGKVAKTGDTMTGSLTATALTASGNIASTAGNVTAGATIAAGANVQAGGNVTATAAVAAGGNITTPAVVEGSVVNGTSDVRINNTSVKSRSIHTGTQAPATISPQGSGSGLNADTVDSMDPGNGPNTVPVSNGTVCSNLNADLLDGSHGSTYLARANHTGSQTAATISDFNATGDARWLKKAESGDQSVTMGSGSNTLTLNGNLFVNGQIDIAGAKNRVALGKDGARRRLAALESPEPYFEDFGRGQLVHGEAVIRVPDDFALHVDLTDYYVLLTPEDPAVLYVAERAEDSFVVGVLSGDPHARFVWRLVARQGDLPATRLAPVEV